jgi:hypothetical protein
MRVTVLAQPPEVNVTLPWMNRVSMNWTVLPAREAAMRTSGQLGASRLDVYLSKEQFLLLEMENACF